MNVYLLSILDDFKTGMCVLSSMGIFIATIAIVIGAFEEKEKMVRTGKRVFISGLIMLMIAGLVPTRKGLIEAWIIVEGKEIANHENVEKLLKRSDEITERILNRMDMPGHTAKDKDD